MPQFCLFFYAILQFWRPKKGWPWHNARPPSKYAPGLYNLSILKLLKKDRCRIILKPSFKTILVIYEISF